MSLQADFEADVRDMHPYVPLPAFVYAINISLANRYVYVETPKCACTTIKLTLQRIELRNPDFRRASVETIHARDFSPLLNPKQVPSFKAFAGADGVTRLCVVRNPYDRLLSAYLDKICCPNSVPKTEVLRHLGIADGRSGTQISFEQFVDVVVEQPLVNMNIHWRPQYYQAFHGAIQYTVVGRVENLVSGMRQFGDAIGVDAARYLPAERYNETRGELESEQHFTPEIRRKIHRKFEIDFDHFEYERGFA